MNGSPASSELADFIRTANMPQLGSYGEAVYEELMTTKGHVIRRLHVGRADFEVNGHRIDVKTTRQGFARLLQKPIFKYRHPIPNTFYAILEFHRGGALLSQDDEIISKIPWAFLKAVFKKWREGGFGKTHQLKGNIKTPLSPELIETTKKLFQQQGIPSPYLLYRTVMFDKESPHNLLPTQRKPKDQLGFTVFFVFHKAPPEEGNLKEIIAFPDSADSQLLRLKKLRTASHIKNLEKADIDLLPKKYRFESLELLSTALENGWPHQ